MNCRSDDQEPSNGFIKQKFEAIRDSDLLYTDRRAPPVPDELDWPWNINVKEVTLPRTLAYFNLPFTKNILQCRRSFGPEEEKIIRSKNSEEFQKRLREELGRRRRERSRGFAKKRAASKKQQEQILEGRPSIAAPVIASD